MNKDLIGEVLARVGEHLPEPGPHEMPNWESQPALAELAQQVRLALTPVEPTGTFRQLLEKDLLTAWRAPTPRAEPGEPTNVWLTRKHLLLGTAAVGSIASLFSLLGLVLLMVRRRLTARPAPQGHGGVVL
ncbi:MAG: hypothetical protein KKA73_00865 [Chloroflexi bacterium]|nr:hypothetical protein [Chloroflexota bacterium]MBU1746214.1 hypothetical protein [Chloroflexota bacterium]